MFKKNLTCDNSHAFDLYPPGLQFASFWQRQTSTHLLLNFCCPSDTGQLETGGTSIRQNYLAILACSQMWLQNSLGHVVSLFFNTHTHIYVLTKMKRSRRFSGSPIYFGRVHRPSSGWMTIKRVSHHKLQSLTLKMKLKGAFNTMLCRFRLVQNVTRNYT